MGEDVLNQGQVLTEAVIDIPTLADKAGWLFAMAPVGRAAQRHREMRSEAERLASSDTAKACQVFERIERLLVWDENRDEVGERELAATIIRHAELVRKDSDPIHAARLLLLARRFSKLAESPDSLEFLSTELAGLHDTSARAMDVYVDFLSAAATARMAIPQAVDEILRTVALPVDPLGAPDDYQAEIISRLHDANHSYGLANYGMAVVHFHAANFADALRYAERAARANVLPRESLYISNLCRAQIAMASRDLCEANNCFILAATSFPDRVEPHKGIATAAALRTSWSIYPACVANTDLKTVIDEGIRAGREAKLICPGDIDVACSLVRLLVSSGDYGAALDAIEHFDGVVTRPCWLADEAMARMRKGDTQRALDILSEAQAKYPLDFDVLVASGELNLVLDDFVQASKAFKSALEITAESSVALSGAGRALVNSGAYTEAIKLLSRAPSAGHRQPIYWLGRALLKAHRFTDSAITFVRLLNDNPTYDECYYGASALAQSDRLDDALTALETAETLDPNNPDLQVLFCKVLLKMGQLQNASARLGRVEQIAPAHSELPYLSAALAAAGVDVVAVDLLRRLTEIDTLGATHLDAAAVVHMNCGNFGQAETCAARALRESPSDAMAAVLHAMALLRQGRLAEAESAIALLGATSDSARNGAPADTSLPPLDHIPKEIADAALWILGKCRAGIGRYDSAADCWQSLLRRNPLNERLRLNIDRLHYLIGLKCVEENDYEGALVAWTAFAESRDGDEVIEHDIGELRFRIGVTTWDDRMSPGDSDHLAYAMNHLLNPGKAHFFGGLRSIKGGNHALAVEHFTGASRSGDVRYVHTALLWLGLTHYDDADYESAETVLKELMSDAQCGSKIRVATERLLGLVFMKQGRWDDIAALGRSDRTTEDSTTTERVDSVVRTLPSVGDLIDLQIVSHPTHSVGVQNPYYAGLLKAKAGQFDEAETLLKQSIAADSGACDGMRCAAGYALAEVYRYVAEHKLAERDLGATVRRLDLAVALDNGNARVRYLMDSLQSLGPLISIIAGKREIARDTWSSALTNDPTNSNAAHSLALLYFYWAKEHLTAGNLPHALDAWERSSEFWSMVLKSPQFEQAWIKNKTAIYGKQVDGSVVAAACSHAAAVVLRTILDTANSFRTGGDDRAYRATMITYGMVVGELKAAELLAEIKRAVGGRLADQVRVGGPRALARHGGLDAVKKVASKATGYGVSNAVVSRLSVAYSGRVPEWGLFEAKQFELLIRELEHKADRNSEQDDLLANAYFELAVLANNDSGAHASFGLWEKALKSAASKSPLRADIENQAIAAAKAAITHAQHLDIATMRTVVDDMRALARLVTTDRFKANLSSAIRHMAILESNSHSDASVSVLLEEALEYNPGNQAAQRDLAVVLCGEAIGDTNKALEIYNARQGAGDKPGLEREIGAAADKLIRSLQLDPGNQSVKIKCAALGKILNQLEMNSKSRQLSNAMKA